MPATGEPGETFCYFSEISRFRKLFAFGLAEPASASRSYRC